MSNPTEALDAIEQALQKYASARDFIYLDPENDVIKEGVVFGAGDSLGNAASEALAHLATLKQQVAELVAQNTTLIESLEEIVEPVAAMQRRCAALGDGRVIDGMMAIALANDPNNLKIIAKKALSNVTPPADEGGQVNG